MGGSIRQAGLTLAGLTLVRIRPRPRRQPLALIVLHERSPSIAESERARLVVYDLLGREVRLLLDGRVEAGVHEVSLDAMDLPSGLYLYRLEAGSKTLQRTMTLLR